MNITYIGYIILLSYLLWVETDITTQGLRVCYSILQHSHDPKIVFKKLNFNI